MGVDMSEFKLSFLGQRRRAAREPNAPLNEVAEQIRDLDEAAQLASRRINQSARKLRASHKWHPGSSDDALADLADSLVERADGIRGECRQLLTLLERAKSLVDAAPAEPRVKQAAPPHASPSEDDVDTARSGVPEELASSLLQGSLEQQREGSAWQGPVGNGGAAEAPAPEGMRLIATQMAIAGSTRPEIQAHLQERFGIDDATPVLDEIFGQARDAS